MNDKEEKKLLLLSPLPPPSGGIARWTERYLSWMQSKVDTVVVNTSVTGERIDRAGASKKITDEIKRAFLIIKKTKQAMRTGSIKVMHLNTSCSKMGIFRDDMCVKVAKAFKIPVVLHCHCNIADQLGKNQLSTRTFEHVAKAAKEILVLNNTSLEYVKDLGIKTVRICPNFLDDDQIANTHKIENEIKTITFVGNVCPEKGIELIYGAAKSYPNITFRIIGPMSDLIAGLNYPDNVILLGPKSSKEVKKELDMADVFLFPSYSEGFSVALLEAMGRGTPVIASDVGANREMISEHGGIILKELSVQEIVTSISKLEDVNLRKSMSKWNIEKCKKQYTLNIVMEELMSVYDGLY